MPTELNTLQSIRAVALAALALAGCQNAPPWLPSVDPLGPGRPSPSVGDCGGLLGLTCDANEYCRFEPADACGAADALGSCTPRPEICTDEFAPVCGCDGATYGNACEAAAAGVSVASDGECGASRACGGPLSRSCAAGEYCRYEPAAACGAGGATGTCEPRPEVCIEIYAPVCGCDGVTYGNACKAAGAGVSVASEGECGASRACGGPLGGTCATGEYCRYEPADACGAGGATGTCEPRPEVCIEIYAPVCGCDGVTYGNACKAAGAGQSVASNGPCA